MSTCPDCQVRTGFTLGRLRCQPCKERKRGEDRDFYLRTQHCGACGQPGTYCLCTEPCGCHELHEVGSGVGVDPVAVFAQPRNDDQSELF